MGSAAASIYLVPSAAAVLFNRLGQGNDIGPRHVGLQHVGGRQEQTATFSDRSHAFLNHSLYLTWGAERHGGLGANGAGKRQPVAIPSLDLGRVHALRLHRVQDIDPDLDQLRNDSLAITITMIPDENIG